MENKWRIIDYHLILPDGTHDYNGNEKHRQILEAAPELLEALKAIRDSEENDLGEYAEFCEQTARAALAKAGEEV